MHAPASVDDLFQPFECDRIVDLAGGQPFEDAGLVNNVRRDDIRRAAIAWLDDEGDAAWVLKPIVSAIAEVNRRSFRFDLQNFEERLQVARYHADASGHFDWHVDIGDTALARRRKLTIVVQLSDSRDYDGGMLETNADGHVREASRRQGTAMVFPSFVLHRVTPVSRGARHSLTCWVHGPELR